MTLTFRTAQRSGGGVTAPLRRFANRDVVCEGWYCVGPSSAVRPGGARPASIGDRRLALFRDRAGALHAVDRACGHLGADLAHGAVDEGGLRCPFHQWCWAPDGTCVAGGGAAAGVRIGGYPVRERWGLAWIWAGAQPAYELPAPDPSNEAYVWRLPAQRIGCHPHVVLGNGLDLSHVVGVHRFHFERDPVVEPDPPHRLSVSVRVRFHATAMRRLLGLADRTAEWRFTTIGPSLAWVRVAAPTPFELLWAARPLADGGCATQTIFFLPRLRTIVRAVPMMIATTWADRRVLEGLAFAPGFVASDAVFARYAQLVEQIPDWPTRPTGGSYD